MRSPGAFSDLLIVRRWVPRLFSLSRAGTINFRPRFWPWRCRCLDRFRGSQLHRGTSLFATILWLPTPTENPPLYEHKMRIVEAEHLWQLRRPVLDLPQKAPEFCGSDLIPATFVGQFRIYQMLSLLLPFFMRYLATSRIDSK